MAFAGSFARVILKEGGYSADPADSGGATRYGISESVARANGYEGDMAALPLDTAKAVYKTRYWDLANLDAIDALSPALTDKLFELGVNCGIGTAGRFLQRALNVLNRDGSDYPDIAVDGALGPGTVHALARFVSVRGQAGIAVLLKAVNGQAAYRYLQIAMANPKDERFAYGWFANRIA